MKNDNAIPAATISVGVSASPNRPAAAAEPTRKLARVARRPHTSISHAATAYPGSCASVMISVYWKDFTRSKPWFTSRLGSQMKAP